MSDQKKNIVILYSLCHDGKLAVEVEGERYKGRLSFSKRVLTFFLGSQEYTRHVARCLKEVDYFSHREKWDQLFKTELDRLIQQEAPLDRKEEYLMKLLVAKRLIAPSVKISELFHEQLRRILVELGFERVEH